MTLKTINLMTSKQKFHEIKLIANKGNYGFSSGCNLGADNAHGEYLAIFKSRCNSYSAVLQ